MKTTSIALAGLDLEFAETGDGPPLLWLHGGLGPASSRPALERIARHRRVLAPSHPGFGASSLPDWIDSVDDIAHLYLELLNRQRIDTFDLVGCSLGGWIAAEIGTKIPQRVRRLVMVGPVGVKLGPVDRLDIPDIFAMPQTDVDRLIFHNPARYALDPAALSDDELAAAMRARETLALLVWEPWMHNPKLRHRLHVASMPALFVRGDSDGLVSADYLAGYAALLPDARTEAIAQAGHAPELEQPQALAETVLSFLDS